MPYTAVYILQSDEKKAFDHGLGRMLEVRSELGFSAELTEVRLVNTGNIQRFEEVIAHAKKLLNK